MELYSKRESIQELSMKKTELSAEDRLAQQQFAQSVPIIERDYKKTKPATDNNPR